MRVKSAKGVLISATPRAGGLKGEAAAECEVAITLLQVNIFPSGNVTIFQIDDSLHDKNVPWLLPFLLLFLPSALSLYYLFFYLCTLFLSTSKSVSSFSQTRVYPFLKNSSNQTLLLLLSSFLSRYFTLLFSLPRRLPVCQSRFLLLRHLGNGVILRCARYLWSWGGRWVFKSAI